jgi:uncharacterized protein YecE (DUF72 family)
LSRETVRIGTSGWSYGHWRGSFHPEKLPSAEFLAHYASVLNAVEINNSFYRDNDEQGHAARNAKRL